MSLLEPIEDFHLQLIGVLGRNRFSDLFYLDRLGKMQKKSIFKLRFSDFSDRQRNDSRCQFQLLKPPPIQSANNETN